jgi:hypothetical protein
MVVDVGRSAKVSGVWEGLEDSGGRCTGHCSCIHLPKDHSSGFNEANGGMEGEEFTGRAGAERVGIVHAETIRDPIKLVSR